MQAERIATVEGPLVEGARTAEATAVRLRDRVVAGAKDRLETSREYVAENPMKSVLVAVGVGALLGYLLGRRTS